MKLRNSGRRWGAVAGTGFVVFLSGVSLAGPNAGGMLIVSAHPEVVVTTDPGEDYCPDLLLKDCELANTIYNGPEAVVMGVYAVFPPPSSPRVTGVTLGIQYDPAITISSFGNCGDFELPNADWPASGEGTAVTWDTAQTGSVQPVYWFVGYEYYQVGGIFALIDHPTAGSAFADDSIPAVLDDVVAFGALGFNGAPGAFVCPESQAGACCLGPPECRCVVVIMAECDVLGGNYGGDGTVCDPSPCIPCPSGACCLPDDTCVFVWEFQCEEAGGIYQGDNMPCFPELCLPVPVEHSTWGRIKSLYR